MADFCNKCEKDILNVDDDNLTVYNIKNDECINILCEGCGGFVWVDKFGCKVSKITPIGWQSNNI